MSGLHIAEPASGTGLRLTKKLDKETEIHRRKKEVGNSK